MSESAKSRTLAQIRRVAKWWLTEVEIERDRSSADDWHAQAALACNRQAEEWSALGDLLQAALAHQAAQPNALGVRHFELAAQRLADRMDPNWRRAGEADGG